jgi:cysteine sulfinate desulfinase/cysteine desulfurase-like protein
MDLSIPPCGCPIPYQWAFNLLEEVGQCVVAPAGATCHLAGGAVSSILRAMQVPESFVRGTLRLSLGPLTTTDNVDRAAVIIAGAVQ